MVELNLSIGFYLLETKKLQFSTYDVFRDDVFKKLAGDEAYSHDTGSGSIVGEVVHTTTLSAQHGDDEDIYGLFLQRPQDKGVLIVIGIPVSSTENIFITSTDPETGKVYKTLKD
jgi:hypothetical protein